MSKSNSALRGLTAQRSYRRFIAGLTVLTVIALCAISCNPEAQYETKDVAITISPSTISAAYIECSFTTDKEAYYLIACEPAQPGVNPMEHQKPFMMLALDSANTEYINWRHDQLTAGEFNIAPYSSHCLQYGNIDHFFTNLIPDTDYWIYAFVVEPEKIQPAGKLFMQKVRTKKTSVVDVHFEYRIRGYWDYIYPLNPDGKINNHFPYLAATVDSLTLVNDWDGISPEQYFTDYFQAIADVNAKDEIRYGVQVVYNDGYNTKELFELGHTYYTAIVSFDGHIGFDVIYRFTWTGEEMEAYFKPTQSIVK